MSLIDEALKRAELEAARRDGLRTGASPWVMEARPRPRRGRWIAAAVLLLAVAGGAAFWLIGRSPAPVVSPPPPQSTVESKIANPKAKMEMETVEVPPPPAVVKPKPPGRSDGARPSGPKSESASRPVEAGGPAPVQPETRASSMATAPEAGRSARGLANGRTYVGEVSIPDGGKIALEGIVWSESNPIALVNGKVLPPGAIIEEFTIISIQPDRVELKGRGLTIYLALK